MNTQNSKVQGIEAIEALDLSNVIGRLQQPLPKGKGWSDEETANADKWYRRFLILALKHGEGLVPSKQVDELWHAHILDMRKYEADTKRIFGKVFYHKPAFGTSVDLQPQIAKTHALCVAEFGEAPGSQLAMENSDCDQGCSGGDCNADCSM